MSESKRSAALWNFGRRHDTGTLVLCSMLDEDSPATFPFGEPNFHRNRVPRTLAHHTSETPLRDNLRFPTSGFTLYWTLSSKFFSTFAHATCLLSVSQWYLALGDAYLLLQAALSSNPTLKLAPSYWHRLDLEYSYGTLTLCGQLFVARLNTRQFTLWTQAASSHAASFAIQAGRWTFALGSTLFVRHY